VSSYSYQIDTAMIKQRILNSDKDRAVNHHQSDSVDISDEGRNTLKEKMSAIEHTRQSGDVKELASISSGAYGIMNDFEKIMSELDGDFDKEKGTKTNTFDSYVNKMTAAYQLMKERIEEKYTMPDKQKEYYTAEDGNMQELTKEKELEMLDKAYETHSSFMATSTQIWSELQDFKVQTVYHSGRTETEASTTTKQNTDIKEQAYNAFLSAINEENIGLLKQKQGDLNNLHLNLGISSPARNMLNGIWDYYSNIK
ncbi:MAG: hypothetical protein HDR29_07860, partial [Lachnospiraceae bacterium]|nr:hypothetical protein [Lachnospiraceae bacterium]